ncbi:MAG: CHASE3 domain-containing protein [Leptolyngbyaceae cyanobacterium HOT.MB2.61]|nr:CHASE3 domain-containing protein [Leptolyngbyaceae cyanobacterium HOT.MB2.61]
MSKQPQRYTPPLKVGYSSEKGASWDDAQAESLTNWGWEGKWITGGFGLVLLLIGTVSFISYQNAIQLAESARRVRQTQAVLNNLNSISTTLIDAESGRRGYILFGDPEELKRYDKAIENLNPQLERLRQTLTAIPIQQQRLNNLEALIAQRLALSQQSIDYYLNRRGQLSFQDPFILQSKHNRDNIRQVITSLIAEEENLLEMQVEQSQNTFQLRILIELLGTLLTFATLLGVFALVYRQLIKRHRAEALQQILAREKELSELKLQFFSMVSHEFRTPLSLIIGSAQLLEQSLKEKIEPGKLKNLYRIETSAKVMTQMLSDILTLARAEAGKLEFNPSLIEIQTFCLNLVEDFQVYSETKRTIKFIKQGSHTHAWVDEKLLYSILSNLLSNAIKYSSPEKPIYFSLICESDLVKFQVKDEGIGIPREDQSKLCDPFSRGKNTREISGTGLGLALVKTCVDLHQGEILFESEVGVGTTVTVILPQKVDLTR